MMAGGYQGDLMASATVTPEDPQEPYYYVEYTQPIEVVEANSGDITFNVAVIFVLSMIVGLLLFESLSRRWHS